MKKAPIQLISAALILTGCTVTFDGLTEQQYADNYFSCIVLEASRDDNQLTENNISMANISCTKELRQFARALVIEQGIRDRYVDYNAAFLEYELQEQLRMMMREFGAIK